MGNFLLWYLFVTILGAFSIPLVFKFFKSLPGRGFGFTKPFALLVVGYVFWLFTSLQITRNDIGGILFAFLLFGAVNAWLFVKNKKEILAWLGKNKGYIVTTEILFILAFAGWAYVRAANPEILGTEKPMELAFINAILKSPTFPPHDPWLSGYAISYYYFGYVIVALITKVTGVPAGIAFNLAIGLWFSLTAVAAYSLLYDLLTINIKQNKPDLGEGEAPRNGSKNLVFSLLAPFYILVLSNIEGFLEMLHARGIFWTQAGDGTWQSTFWKYLNIAELTEPPSQPFSWVPERIGGIWWWRASRVLQDFDLSGQVKEIIDEFPFFSYYLADLHPHLLAMPFALMAVAICLNLYMGRQALHKSGQNIVRWLFQNNRDQSISFFELEISRMLRTWDFWITAVVMGGLAFLNTWDFPIYVALYAATFTLGKYLIDGWKWDRVWDFLSIGMVTGLIGIILYLPFYFGFSSQAGGILPSLAFFTKGIYFWVMFGTMLVPIFSWIIWVWLNQPDRKSILSGLKLSSLFILAFWIISYILGWLISNLPLLGNLIINSSGENGFLYKLANKMIEGGSIFSGQQGASSTSEILLESFVHRLLNPGTWLTLGVLLALVLAIFLVYRNQFRQNIIEDESGLPSFDVEPFIVLMVLVGIGLTLVPEFLYLRDQFGWRMNTIFKFYFETWIIWGIVASFAIIVLWNKLKFLGNIVFRYGMTLLILMGLAYPIFGLREKLSTDNLKNLTLDGTNYFQQSNPDEWNAIMWLQNAPPGVVAEAIGGSYSAYARVSTNSGQPTVLGWPGHESQWRGGANEIGSRETDIQTLYRTSDWTEAENIITTYNIRYIFIGSMERDTYHANEAKFTGIFNPVYKNATVVIYDVSQNVIERTKSNP